MDREDGGPPERLTADQLALEAGVEADYIDRLAASGVVTPRESRYHWADIYRVRTIVALEDAGIPFDRLAPAFTSGQLSLEFLEYMMPPPSPRTGRTFADFVASFGERGRLVGELYEMLGLAHPPDDMAMREDEEAMVRELLELWSDDSVIMKRAARLAGYAIRLVVEGWTGLHYELYRSLGGGGRDRWPAEVREREPMMAGRAIRLAETIPRWLTLRHYERVLYSDIIENIEMQIDPFEERDVTRPGVPSPAVMFVDLSGFTAMTDAEGDAAAVAATTRFEEAVSLAALRHGGRVVKLLGDGAMLQFPNAGSAAAAVAGLRATLSDLPLGPHAGIDCGPIAERDGDIFGRTVNMASRLASAAHEGQVLLSAAAATAAAKAGYESRPLGSLQLKGLDRPVAAFLLESAETG